MIAQKYRFHGHHSLKYFLRRAQSLKTSFFKLCHLPNKAQANFRLAIIVSKKIDKKAVIRNRIRRRLYEFFRLGLTDLSTPVDIAIIVSRRELAFMSAQDLRNICQPILDQLLRLYASKSK